MMAAGLVPVDLRPMWQGFAMGSYKEGKINLLSLEDISRLIDGCQLRPIMDF